MGRGERLYQAVARAAEQGVGHRRDPNRIASGLLAALIHVPTLALLTLGVVVAVTGSRDLVHWIIVAALVGLVVLVRPRFGRLSRKEVALTAAEAPALFALTDRICAVLGAHPVTWVVVDGSFNASYGHVGLRRRRMLRIGLPLWSVLDDDEKVALLAHELAHDVNGDLAHGFLVSSALQTLATWYRIIHPGPVLYVGGDSTMSAGEALARPLLAGLANLFLAVLVAERRLLLRSSQRAEYLADALAIKVASRDAVITLFNKALLGKAYWFGLRRAALVGAPDLWAAGRGHLATVPAHELTRLHRVAVRRGHQVDDTHPPTALRIRFASTHVAGIPAVRSDRSEMEAVERELAPGYRRAAAVMCSAVGRPHSGDQLV